MTSMTFMSEKRKKEEETFTKCQIKDFNHGIAFSNWQLIWYQSFLNFAKKNIVFVIAETLC